MSGYEMTQARLRAFVSAITKAPGIDGCWVWTRSKNGQGYSSGLSSGPPAHRVAYEWMVGPIPEGMELDHLCRNRACLNPHHLEPVTHRENTHRSRRSGPFLLRRYCRQGHALVGANRRVWSNGGGKREVRCYTCHLAGLSSLVEVTTQISIRRSA